MRTTRLLLGLWICNLLVRAVLGRGLLIQFIPTLAKTFVFGVFFIQSIISCDVPSVTAFWTGFSLFPLRCLRLCHYEKAMFVACTGVKFNVKHVLQGFSVARLNADYFEEVFSFLVVLI